MALEEALEAAEKAADKTAEEARLAEEHAARKAQNRKNLNRASAWMLSLKFAKIAAERSVPTVLVGDIEGWRIDLGGGDDDFFVATSGEWGIFHEGVLALEHKDSIGSSETVAPEYDLIEPRAVEILMAHRR